MTSAATELEPQVVNVRSAPNCVDLDLLIVSDLPVFAGHFPGFPIVPGVCLIAWAHRFSVQHLAELKAGVSHFQVKFRRIVQPGQTLTLTLRRVRPSRVRFDYRHATTVCASGTLMAADAP
jgi:3-hydroxymyristoyl/3-hydroxydecanoyl-(acyl carrier protein) dehydratase